MVMYMMAVHVEMRTLREICILVPHAPTCVNTPYNSPPIHPAHTQHTNTPTGVRARQERVPFVTCDDEELLNGVVRPLLGRTVQLNAGTGGVTLQEASDAAVVKATSVVGGNGSKTAAVLGAVTKVWHVCAVTKCVCVTMCVCVWNVCV